MIKRFLCKLGIHLPKKESHPFNDIVDGNPVYKGHCSCGILWLFNHTMKMRKEHQQGPGAMPIYPEDPNT